MTSNRGDLPLGDRLDRIEAKIDLLISDVSGLKVKASLYGGIAALAVSFLVDRLLQWN